MTTITKEWLQKTITSIESVRDEIPFGLDEDQSNMLTAFKIALASLEAEPVAVNDDMAYAFHHALSDSSLGADEVEEIKAGLRAAFANVTIQPEPVVPAVLERLRTIVADPRALPRRKEWVSGQQYSYVLLENVEAMVDEACRAAMLHGAEPISQTYKLNQLSGNSPVTPDGWISCSERMPNDAQWCVVDAADGYYVQCWSEGQGWLGDDISLRNCDVIRWMPIPEPPQEVK
ncbi:TPA: DUF551 domain-containing protein [Escherichia coli]|nr:DUF551 domain-containing protein [Escherichia coli]